MGGVPGTAPILDMFARVRPNNISASCRLCHDDDVDDREGISWEGGSRCLSMYLCIYVSMDDVGNRPSETPLRISLNLAGGRRHTRPITVNQHTKHNVNGLIYHRGFIRS